MALLIPALLESIEGLIVAIEYQHLREHMQAPDSASDSTEHESDLVLALRRFRDQLMSSGDGNLHSAVLDQVLRLLANFYASL
jgi:hypothetical protein